MPDFSRHYVGPKQERPALTEPEPFALSTDERHRVHPDELRRKVLAEVRRDAPALRQRQRALLFCSGVLPCWVGS